MARGTLFLIVGPSGAGKDSVIAGARARLSGRPGVVFARRCITRLPDAGVEDHEALDAAAFARIRSDGGFMLHWRAHGADYGIRAEYDGRLAAGDRVVANVSRTVVADAARTLAPVHVVEITAPPEALAARLARRGREDGAALLARLGRAVPLPGTAPVTRIVNHDGALEQSVYALIGALEGF